MLLSSPSPKKVFFCPEESNFYSYCLETLAFDHNSSPKSFVEFGTGDGSPVIKALLRTEFAGTVYGFEANSLAYQAAKKTTEQYQLNERYIIHHHSFFDFPRLDVDGLISNPPYLPALDNNLYQPLLHGGIDGTTITRKLLSLNYQSVLVMVASYSNPVGLINHAIANGYAVTNFVITPLNFGYYSSEPKVKKHMAKLKEKHQAFYSDSLYLLAGVLFSQQQNSDLDKSSELIQLMSALT